MNFVPCVSQSIPGGLLPKFQQLVSIDLSHNALTSLPDDIGALKWVSIHQHGSMEGGRGT